MAKNILVISVDARETRAALIEDGIIAELHIERRGGNSGTVGNVYLGKVTRVLPGLQAAFIDIGQERAAFLHVEDLIRPDDFDTYLAGGNAKTKQARSEEDAIAEADAIGDTPPEETSEAEATEAARAPDTLPSNDSFASLPDAGPSDSRLDALDAERDAEVDAEDDDVNDAGSDRDDTSTLDLGDDDSDDDDDSSSNDVAAAAGDDDDAVPALAQTVESAPAVKAAPVADDDDWGDMPGFTVSDPGEPVPLAQTAPRMGDRQGGRGRRRRGGGRSKGGDRGDRSRGRRDGNREHREKASPNRISKSTPIRDVVKEGQEVIVQVSKDPIGTKGARCTSHVSLPGRYVVYVPTVDHIGISKRIGSDKERARLRETIESMKPPSGGLIVRTVAEGLTKKQLKQDVGYLVRLWGEIAKKKEEGVKAPALLSSELDLVLKVARDLFTDDVDEVVIDDKHQFDRLCRFVEMFAPDRLKDVKHYGEEEPIFDAYGIEDEIARALSRKVPLPSGGYLIIDQAEALTAIDVNTGRFVGKGSKDMEETILKTNLEAVHEIAYQLRFRNIGGLIILDLIDMERASNREKVRRTLEELLHKDKAKTSLNRISELGLIEMTRKRTRESLGRLLHEPCFYCDGTGQLQSKETIAFEILREIRRKKNDLPGYSVVVNAHPAVVDVLNTTEKVALQETENRFMRKIVVVPRTEYHIEQFDLVGK